MIEPAQQIEAPLVLISYAWEEEDAEYMNWVERFAELGQIGYLVYKFLDAKLIRKAVIKVIQMGKVE